MLLGFGTTLLVALAAVRLQPEAREATLAEFGEVVVDTPAFIAGRAPLASFRVPVRNTSGEKLQLRSLRISCTCVDCEPEKSPLEPGEVSHVVGRIDLQRSRPNAGAGASVAVEVETASGRTDTLSFSVHVESRSAIVFDGPEIAIDAADESGPKPTTVALRQYELAGRAFTAPVAGARSGAVEVAIQPTDDAGHDEGPFRVRRLTATLATPDSGASDGFGGIVYFRDGTNAASVEVPVRRVARSADFTVNPTTLVVDSLRGRTATARFVPTSAAAVAVVKAASRDPKTVAAVVAASKSEVLLTLTATAGDARVVKVDVTVKCGQRDFPATLSVLAIPGRKGDTR